MRRIRIAQIGTSDNGHGNLIWNSLKKQTDIFEIVGYAFPENEREKFPNRMIRFEGYREMTVQEILEDPTIEAVAIETEEIYLTKYALMAVQHGKQVHMEKPGGTDLALFQQLIDAVKEKGCVFHLGYMYRYNNAIRELMEKIRGGELGEILTVEAHMSCHHPEKLRQWLSTFPGGMMFYLGCHLIDLVYSIQGAPLEVIPMNHCSGLGGVTGLDQGLCLLRYERGISMVKTSAVQKGGFAMRQLVVTGTEGTVELKPLEWYEDGSKELWTGVTAYTNSQWSIGANAGKSVPADRYDGMMAAFAQMVRGERENPFTPDHELEMYRLLLKACG